MVLLLLGVVVGDFGIQLQKTPSYLQSVGQKTFFLFIVAFVCVGK